MRVLPCILTIIFFSLSKNTEANFGLSYSNISNHNQARLSSLFNNDSVSQAIPRGFFKGSCFSYNVLSALNFELGFLFESGRIGKNLSIIIPFAIGLGDPPIESKTHSEWNQGYYMADPTKKQVGLGLGMNYYTSAKLQNKGFVGVCFQAMKFDCTETWSEFVNAYNTPKASVSDQTNLYRFTATLNMGFNFPLHSHFKITIISLLGLRYDTIFDRIKDPSTNMEVPNFDQPWFPYLSFYYCLGYEF